MLKFHKKLTQAQVDMSIVEKDIMSRVKKQNDFYVGQDIGVYTM